MTSVEVVDRGAVAVLAAPETGRGARTREIRNERTLSGEPNGVPAEDFEAPGRRFERPQGTRASGLASGAFAPEAPASDAFARIIDDCR